MSYTNSDIENRAVSLLGKGVAPGSEWILRTVCQAAAAELEAKLRRGVRSSDIQELFVTAAGMLAISMLLESDESLENSVESFTAGNLSVRMRSGESISAATLRKRAEHLLGAYLETGGFEFVGVRG